MNLETVLKIACRIALRVFVFGIAGAILLGLPWGIFFAYLFWNRLTIEGSFIDLGLSAGAIQMGIIGFLTWRRRDWSETLQMTIGGFFIGGLIGLIFGQGAVFILGVISNLKSFDVIYSLIFIFSALIGAFYLALHPKYAPREEPVIIFSDDYLKDEKIEWK